MTKLIHTNTLVFENYKTEFYTEYKLFDFLISEGIPCLSSRFKTPEDFYNSILFKLPSTKKHNNYKMIYFKLGEIKQKEKNIILEGSVKLMDTSLDKPPILKWIIVKI